MHGLSYQLLVVIIPSVAKHYIICGNDLVLALWSIQDNTQINDSQGCSVNNNSAVKSLI